MNPLSKIAATLTLLVCSTFSVANPYSSTSDSRGGYYHSDGSTSRSDEMGGFYHSD